MSWIKDVKDELKTLEISTKALRKFGLLVGGVFLLLGYWIYHYYQNSFFIIFLAAGASLFISGLILPNSLSTVYKLWMGLAFALGWLMSRVLLTVLFYLVITPISFAAKIFGKKFMDIDYKAKKESYWIIKSNNKKIDYSKMY